MRPSIMMYHYYISKQFGQHYKQKIAQEMPLLALPKSCTEAKTHVPQIFSYVEVEKGMEHKGEQR